MHLQFMISSHVQQKTIYYFLQFYNICIKQTSMYYFSC